MPKSRNSIGSFPLPTTPLEPSRATSPVKKGLTVGDASNFLTSLAAQERRVFELREELQKAEQDLSRLKKQWAAHEAVKKRNEFRHLEQLRQIKTADLISCEEGKNDHFETMSSNRYHLSRKNGLETEQPIQAAGEQDHHPRCGRRQTQRKVFAGSRHIRSLSLLANIDTRRSSCEEALQTSPSQISLMEPCESSFSPRDRSARRQLASTRHNKSEYEDDKPKEVFVETSKQLVGGLRDGLWTFFEDIRQATIGEEASSTLVRDNSVVGAGQSFRVPARSQSGNSGSRKILRQELDASRLSRASAENPVLQTRIAKQPVSEHARTAVNGAQRKAEVSGVPSRFNESLDEEPWDTWDSPATVKSASCRKESVTSESLDSTSTGRSSPRSSMRALADDRVESNE
ncbi:MAG: hypothetical protein Q9183_000209 [Haloplaca sp. 2 TL-2023]